MRVVCISDAIKLENGVPFLIKGQIYNVEDSSDIRDEFFRLGYRVAKGIYYKLIENGCWYHNSVFVPIVENEIDETTFERNYQKETA